jgi:hypothetical protein
MQRPVRLVLSVVAGGLTAVAMAIAATMLTRSLWPAYVAAEPTKAYSLAMLIARLAVGACCAAGAAAVTTMVARDRRQVAWWLGACFLLVSLPDHLVYVWADYPAWYHIVYLAYLVPVAGLVGRCMSSYVEGRKEGAAKERQR